MNERFASVRITQLERQAAAAENQLRTLSHVLREIVGKELLRGQAVQLALMDKNMLTDAEVKAALEKLTADAKKDLEAEAKQVAEEKQKAVEILVPSNHQPLPVEAAPVETPEPVKE